MLSNFKEVCFRVGYGLLILFQYALFVRLIDDRVYFSSEFIPYLVLTIFIGLLLVVGSKKLPFFVFLLFSVVLIMLSSMVEHWRIFLDPWAIYLKAYLILAAALSGVSLAVIGKSRNKVAGAVAMMFGLLCGAMASFTGFYNVFGRWSETVAPYSFNTNHFNLYFLDFGHGLIVFVGLIVSCSTIFFARFLAKTKTFNV